MQVFNNTAIMHNQNSINYITGSYITASFIFICCTESKKYELRIKPGNKNNYSMRC